MKEYVKSFSLNNKRGLNILALLILAYALLAGVFDLSSAAILGAYGIFVFLSFLANLESFQEVQVTTSGVIAKVNKTLEEAKVTVETLKKIGFHMAATELSLVVREGRWGGFDEDEKEERKKRVLETLRNLGFTEVEIREVLNEWHTFTNFDYAMSILGGRVPTKLTDAQQLLWKELHGQGLYSPAQPKQLREFFRSSNILSEDLEVLISDYEYYLKTGEHRNFESWKNHANWLQVWNS